jgi:signal transduction histidine kinase
VSTGPPAGKNRRRRSLVAPGYRLTLFVLVSLLSLVNGGGLESAAWLAALGVVALVASRRDREDRTTLALVMLEAGIAALGGVLTGGPESSLLAYLPAATLAAGVAVGIHGAILTSGTAAVVLLIGRTQFTGTEQLGDFTTVAAQWAVLSLATGVLGALLRNLLRDQPVTPSRERYEEAYRLLAQLRAVTRGLPGSLDPGSVATSLIAECRGVIDFNRAGVFMRAGGNVLVPFALEGARRVPWRLDVDDPGPVAQAWRSAKPVLENRAADWAGRRRGSLLLVVPIVVADRAVGVVVMESLGDHEVAKDSVDEVAAIIEAAGLPLETAVLFDELRLSAAAEERQRLAKEMHDGIAQDLAYIGFELDGLLGELRKGGHREQADQAYELRQRITGLISELRLSISDLRSSIAPARGLGAALSEYARSIGTSTGMTVHVSLAEGALRLPADTELQLLRIAHEAMGSARRRRNVRNLWVTLAVEPPAASLVIEDDGDDRVLDGGGVDLQVMRERAERIQAQLDVASRKPHGVRVSVVVGRGLDADSAVG